MKKLIYIILLIVSSNLYAQPLQSRILIATSSDGLNWSKTNMIFNDSADVPDALIGHNGKIFVYFQGLITPQRDGIMVSYSDNGIDKWTTQKINLAGTENWKATACDPDVIYKNGIYRLYFTGNPDDTYPRTFSATSSDGINFQMEQGVRFVVTNQPIMDPSLLQIGDTLHYFAGGAPQGKNWHCTSIDGIIFTRQQDFTVNNLMMANGINSGDGYRFYCFSNTTKAGIYSVFTQNGINWIQDNGMRLIKDNQLENEEVKDPALVKVGNQYIMYYVTRKTTNQQNNGPWNNALRIANSNDGINFNNDKVFQDSSGVPSVIRWRGDTLIAAFQWFREPKTAPSWDRVAVKFSEDNGLNWSEPIPIVVNNLPKNFQRPFDPTLTVNNFGKFRLYFSSGRNDVQGDSVIDTYSAVSYDGVNYTFEPNARYDNNLQKVIDPAVIYFKENWHYLSPKGAPQDGAFHCTSPDGINFIRQNDIPSDNAHNWTGNFMFENDNELRFYGSGQFIWFNKSNDGNNWTNYVNTNLNGGDPSCLKLNDDSYMIIYVGKPNNSTLPEKVTLISPKNNETINQNNVNLIWKKSKPNVGDYNIQVSLNQFFQGFVINDSTSKDSIRSITNLIPDSIYYWRVRGRNPNGWGEFSFVNSFKYNPINDINENKNFEFNIIPNPAFDYLEITSTFFKEGSEVSLEIYNVLGIAQELPQLSYTPFFEGDKLRIDLSNFPAGVYFCKITSGNNFYNYKIIVLK